jgi:hypothetical protein
MTITSGAVPAAAAQPTGAAPPTPAAADHPSEPTAAGPGPATGRLTLITPEKAPAPLPDGIDLDQLMTQIHNGGHVVVRLHPDGPPMNTVSPTGDPQPRAP